MKSPRERKSTISMLGEVTEMRHKSQMIGVTSTSSAIVARTLVVPSGEGN
jgi:hypothetical protein